MENTKPNTTNLTQYVESKSEIARFCLRRCCTDSFLQLAEHPRELCRAHADAAAVPAPGRRVPAQQLHEVATRQDQVRGQARQNSGTHSHFYRLVRGWKEKEAFSLLLAKVYMVVVGKKDLLPPRYYVVDSSDIAVGWHVHAGDGLAQAVTSKHRRKRVTYIEVNLSVCCFVAYTPDRLFSDSF